MNNQYLHDWIWEVNGKLSKMERIAEYKLQRSRGRNNSIHRIPAYICEKLHPQDYKPYWVGFGPYHDRDEYSGWHQIKERVLLYFLRRSKKPLDKYVEAMAEEVQNLKDAYDELGSDNWFQDNDNVILKLMIHDGCFLLEILHELKNLTEANYLGKDYYSDNPLWDIEGIRRNKLVEHYKHDMLLLENQLPLQLLVSLHAVQIGKDSTAAFADISTYMLWIFWPTLAHEWDHRKFLSFELVHVLDLYRHILIKQEAFLYSTVLSEVSTRRMIKVDPEFNFNIPSATDLKDAGIRITMSKTKCLMWLSFEHGNLKLPQIYVDGATRSRFISIIGFEQLNERNAFDFTSYFYFMSGLLKGANDVSILKSCGIIRSSLHNDEVAEMFNSLSKDIMRDPQTFLTEKFIDLSKSLIKSFDKRNKEWKKDLWHNYLRSPWAIVSLFAAFLLFALSSVQTVYTVLGYYNSK